MTMIRPGRFGLTLLAAAVSGLVLLAGMPAGCSKDREGPEYSEIEGTVSGIDGEGGTVRMRWYSPKRNETIELTGFLAPDAEILIDGRTARLEDVRVEDRVVVVGRQEKRDGERRLVATRVEVRRNEAAAGQTPAQHTPDTGPSPDAAAPPPDAGAAPDAAQEPSEPAGGS